MKLNDLAQSLCESLPANLSRLRVQQHHVESGSRLFDFGIDAEGGLEAGILLAEVCMAGLGTVAVVSAESSVYQGPAVTVRTDHPVAACMASQYAGWQVTGDDFFAMGSGPMRAAAGREALFERIGLIESPRVAVGVLEAARLPPPQVCEQIAAACAVEPECLTLLVAPTASQAGALQVVARTVETALHKMCELGVDLNSVVSGFGCAPLPPVAGDDLAGIGRTNDAVLYGGQVTLWVRADDESLETLVTQLPSQASRDYGQPFADIFKRYDGDFYKIDPLLFSPAHVTLVNLNTGCVFAAGGIRADLIYKSFGC